MTIPRKFQLMLPLAKLDISPSTPPPPSELKALTVEYNKEKILSVHYSLSGDSRKDVDQNDQPQAVRVLKTWLRAYFSKSEKYSPFDDRWLDCSVIDSSEDVNALNAVRTTDFGKPRTYGEIGNKKVCWNDREAVEKEHSEAGDPLGWAVGVACGNNPFAIVVPCYRLVQSGHYLGHFANGHNPEVDEKTAREIKRWLLMHEGCGVPCIPGKPMSKWRVFPRIASDED